MGRCSRCGDECPYFLCGPCTDHVGFREARVRREKLIVMGLGVVVLVLGAALYLFGPLVGGGS